MTRHSVFSMKGGGAEYIGIVRAGEVSHVRQLMERELKKGRKTVRVLLCLKSGGLEFVNFQIIKRYSSRREAAEYVNSLDWDSLENDMMNSWPCWQVDSEFSRLENAMIRSTVVDEWVEAKERGSLRSGLSVEMS